MTRLRTTDTHERKRLILETALELFTHRGYFNTSVHDIQRAANVSIGSIYHHFGNKEGIAKALYDDLIGQMAEAVDNITQERQSLFQRGRAVVAYLFEMAESRPEAMHYILYARHREFMPGEKPICSSRPFEMMKEMVREGIETGEIRPIDPTIASASLFGGAIRLIHLRLDGALEKTLAECTADIWQCAWRAVAPG